MISQHVVVDVGNSALHLGEFEQTCGGGSLRPLSLPQRTLEVPCDGLDFEAIELWLGNAGRHHPIDWKIGSVNPAAQEELIDWIEGRGERYRLLTHLDLPLKTTVASPQSVGIDRLAAAVAANQLRNAMQAALIVDAGTAITIDCVAANGTFLGGIIAPGLCMSFASLNQKTAQLPLTDLQSPPPLLGNATGPAIQAGVYWMTVGGIDSLLSRLREELASPCSILATGGAMSSLLPHLRTEVVHYPHLVLSGLAWASDE